VKLSFHISTFNALTYFFAISEKLLHENMQKNTKNHTIYLTAEERSQAVRK